MHALHTARLFWVVVLHCVEVLCVLLKKDGQTVSSRVRVCVSVVGSASAYVV